MSYLTLEIGDVFKSNYGDFVKIFRIINSKNIVIEFQEGHTETVQYQQLIDGRFSNKMNPTIYGLGYLGVGSFTPKNYENYKSCYKTWRSMFVRCYDEDMHIRRPNYIGCSVSEEWYSLQEFSKFFIEDPYRQPTWHLDKDILYRGNKIYSPEYCCFVPMEINSFFTYKKSNNSGLPTGVSKKGNIFCAAINIDGNLKYIGSFSNEEQAKEAYLLAKKQNALDICSKYKGKIDDRVITSIENWDFSF